MSSLSAAKTPPRSIADLSTGEAGTIAAVGCDRPIALRLMEMGLLPGTRVELVRVAPLGDPVELRVRGYSLSIRKAEARLVSVEVERSAEVERTSSGETQDVDEAFSAQAPASTRLARG